MNDKDFLARWSRLKRSAEQAKPETPQPPEVPDVEPSAAAAPALPVPELPPLDSLTAASDFKPFLQAGVPDSLRAAALRRLWSIDPEIRDFIGPARDYGWDWNTPGGVPGSGPLPSAEQIAKLVEQIFGVPEHPGTKDGPTAQVASAPTPAIAPRESGAAQPQRASGSPPAHSDARGRTQIKDLQSENKEQPPASRPRHGSATPS